MTLKNIEKMTEKLIKKWPKMPKKSQSLSRVMVTVTISRDFEVPTFGNGYHKSGQNLNFFSPYILLIFGML